jgi:CheY-specific phosphatase CheX
MGVKFFGQYLLEKNLITPEQLVETVEYQESKNLKFGEYALSKGYLTKEDIKRIQEEQKHVDMKFGEIAVKLNILTPEQVEEILRMQKNEHIFIGEALVKKGFLTPEVLERELALFKEDQSKYITGEITVPEGVKNPEIVKDMVDMTQKMFQRIVHLNVKIDEGFISNKEPQGDSLMISVPLYGSLNYVYTLSTPWEISELVAEAIMGEDIKNESKELIIDGVKEFCNIVCGNIIAKLARRGKKVDIKPPQEVTSSKEERHLLNGREGIFYPLISPRGNSTLILIEGQ